MTGHHGLTPEQERLQSELVKRFIAQGERTATPSFPDGKISEHDEGALAYAIATDGKNEIIRIDFNKPVEWLGLDIPSAENLEREIHLRIAELRLLKLNQSQANHP